MFDVEKNCEIQYMVIDLVVCKINENWKNLPVSFRYDQRKDQTSALGYQSIYLGCPEMNFEKILLQHVFFTIVLTVESRVLTRVTNSDFRYR